MKIKNFTKEEVSLNVLQVLDLFKKEFMALENKLSLVNRLYLKSKQEVGNLLFINGDVVETLLQPISKKELVTNHSVLETSQVLGDIEFDMPIVDFIENRIVIGGIENSDDLMLLFRMCLNSDSFFAFSFSMNQFAELQKFYIKEGKLATATNFKEKVKEIDPKKTIFVGCADPTLIEKITNSFGDDIFVAVMSQDVLKARLDSLNYEKVSEEHRLAVEAMQVNEENKAKSLQVAKEIYEYYGDSGCFSIANIKEFYLHNKRGKFTNKQIIELFDFLITMNRITCVNPHEEKLHKRLFAVTIDDVDLLKSLNVKLDILNKEIEALHDLRVMTEENIEELSHKIQAEADLEIPNEGDEAFDDSTIREVNPANVEGSEEFNEANEQEKPSDYINDRGL